VLSESTLKKLQGIRKCSINGHKVKNLFQIVLNAPDLWEQAYGNIYNNKGGMTPGVDGLTMDGYSHERAANVRELLRENRYVPPPVVRAYVSKPNGKQRPLGKPTANDKQVQEVWRMILESIYEPVFKDSSHGFRMQKSCHTALKRIESTWQGTKWFIEFDIEGFFNNIDHKILMELLEKKIDDEKFLNLIRKIVKAGYVEEWKYNETYSGTPQGGILSPILANIYLHELDCYVETLIADFERGKTRRGAREYNLLKYHVGRLNKQIEQEKDQARRSELLERKKALQRRTLEIPSVDQHDPHYRRLRYYRYADDFVLGAICPKSEAEEIYRKIETFLKEELRLNVSHAKSGIQHNTETIRFLGYDIRVRHDEKTVKTVLQGQPIKKRTMKGTISLMVPDAKLKSFADKHGYGNWETLVAKHNTFLTNASDTEIARRYSAEMRGIAQYYALAKNFATALGKLRILWIRSFLKTMANKHQTSVQKIATMLNRGSYMAVRETGSNGKTTETKLFRVKDVKRKAIPYGYIDNPPLVFKYTGGSELLKRMNANKCEYCGTEGGYFENHHVRHLADMKEGKQPWQQLMIARKRKTLVLCVDCHHKLHAGKLPDRRYLLK
jgi:group II intron reverse transcriptase/maturase